MVLRPDQTKGFGIYLLSVIIVVLVSGVCHFAALSVLQGKIFAPRSVSTQRAEPTVGSPRVGSNAPARLR